MNIKIEKEMAITNQKYVAKTLTYENEKNKL